MSRPRVNWLIVEVVKNLRSRPVGALLLGAMSFAIGLLVLVGSASQVAHAVTMNATLNAKGAQVWRVHPPVPIDASQCEALSTLGGIKHSGSVQRTFSGTIEELPGATARVVYATGGYMSIMWPGADDAVTAGVGSELFRAYGIRSGQRLSITEIGGQAFTASVEVDRVLEGSKRDIQANQSLVVKESPASTVSECLVEADAGAAGAVDRYLAGQFGAAALSRLYIADDVALSPDASLTSRASIWLPIAGGLILVLVGGMQFYMKRTDWALYRLLGVGQGRGLLMIVVEVVLSVALPLSAGLSAGIALSLSALREPLVRTETTFDVLRLLLLVGTLPLVSWLVLRRKNVAEWFKGE